MAGQLSDPVPSSKRPVDVLRQENPWKCRGRRRQLFLSSSLSVVCSRSLLSTVTAHDKMMESMSNAVAILFVTGGAFAPSQRAVDISTSLNSRATLLPFNPLVHHTTITFFFFLFFLHQTSSSPEFRLDGQCTRHLSKLGQLSADLLPIYFHKKWT